ncbi:MAG: hypothetical protein JO149_03045, partial [Gammaproteobacteria bacterium]|nr:hypothetical protein [Gammaproteobacteria bacterium]
MFKKIIAMIALWFLSLSSVFAANIYLAPTLMFQNTYKDGIRYEEVSPKFSLGYSDTVHEMVYIAGEMFASMRGYELHNHLQNGMSLKTKSSVGISFLPGYYFDPLLLGYLRLGFIDTDFSQFNTKKKGWQVGAGLQTNLSPCWDVRGEYV